MSAAASRDLLLPRRPAGLLPGATLALLAHAALLLALTTVVQWRASTPDAVSAELWSAVPQVAAPSLSPPPPPPSPAPAPRPVPVPAPRVPPRVEPVQPDPQIAIAQAKAERQKKERERAELERAEKERERKARQAQALAEAKVKAEADAGKREQLALEQREKAKAEEKRLAEQRQKNLARMMGQAGSSSTTTGAAAQSSGPSASYTGRLVAAIKPNIVFTDTVVGNPAAEVEVRAGPSGSIIARRLLRSSGNKDWDEAVLRAIDRTATLPRDIDGRVPSTIIMDFRPQE